MIDSLDKLLGLVGGISSIVWSVLVIVMSGYESFKFNNSLISSIYPTSPLDFESSDVPPNENKAKQEIMRTVSERGKYFYNYSEYVFAKWLSCWCCCLNLKWMERRVKKLERHEAASKKLAKEVDICKLVQNQRMTQFLSKL